MARAVLRRVRGVTSATIRASKTRNWPSIVNHRPPGSNNAGLISLSDFERRSAFHQARPRLPPPAILLRLLCTVVVQVRAWVDKRVHRVTRWTRVNPLFAVDTSNGMENTETRLSFGLVIDRLRIISLWGISIVLLFFPRVLIRGNDSQGVRRLALLRSMVICDSLFRLLPPVYSSFLAFLFGWLGYAHVFVGFYG